MAADLCLPILKFSFASGVRADNSIPWTHLQANDIFAIVKGTDSPEGPHPDVRRIPNANLRLRILHGTKLLEDVNVAELVDAAVEARRGAERVGVTPQIEQLPIFGITKESLLALRYRLPDGQARRLQLRMPTPMECRQVVGVFERRGMEFQEQRARTARPTTSRPTTSATQDRLLTPHSNSPYFEPSKSEARPSPLAMHISEAESSSRRTVMTNQRSPSRPSDQYALQLPQMAPPPFLNRDEIMAPRDVALIRPSTAQIYRSCTTLSQPFQSTVSEAARRISDPHHESSPLTSHIPMHKAVREEAGNESTLQRGDLSLEPPSLPPPRSTEDWSSTTGDPTNFALQSSDLAELRLSTARTSTDASTAPPDTQEFEIPPKRDLPFKRPGGHKGGDDRHTSRPTSSPMTMPPLPKPKLVKGNSELSARPGSMSSSKEKLDSRPNTSSPLKRTFDALEDEAVVRPQTISAQPFTTRLPATISSSSVQSPSAKTAKDVSPEVLARRPSRMDELLYGRVPLAERSTNTKAPRISSLVDAAYEIESPPTSPAKALGDRDYDPTLNAYAASRSTAHDPRETSLEEYATQSLQDRQAALDEFMIGNLENPAFTKLCEDVENCWRRIALGL